MNQNLYSFFQVQFPADGTKPFLIHARGTVSFDAVESQTARYGAVLQASGVQKGDRVIVQVQKSPEAVLLYLACLRIGAIFIPLNTAYTLPEVQYFVEDSTPAVIVCDPAQEATMSAAFSAHVLTLGENGEGSLPARAASTDQAAPIATCDQDTLAAILYTSGTTGRSKGAMLTIGNLASNARVLHEYWGWEKGDVLLHALPIFHVHGLFVALHCALLNGSSVLFHNRFDTTEVIKDLPKATVMMGVPTFYTRLLEAPGFDRATCRNIRLFISGSAPLLADTFASFEQRTGHRILERYGMTEAGMIASNPYEGIRIAGTVGYALPKVHARVADANGTELPRGEVGVLEIAGPNVFAGYWQMPEKTAEEFRADGYFITGDMATMARDGRITIVGRAKDLVISGGVNVYPKEVEDCIDALPSVKESAVIGLPHPDFGEGVAAVIVAQTEVDEAELRAHLAKNLAKFKQPKKIFIVADLPRNTMGKVQKKTLRESYAGTFSDG